MADAIRLRSVVALSGRFPVLAGADLTVSDGQVVLLRGANGAGKTSLLRVCAGLLGVTSGEASVLGHDLTAGTGPRRAIRRLVGLLGHDTFLYDDLTVRENVRFSVRAAGHSVRAADAALDELGLGGRLADLTAAKLSAGQRRRAALAVVVPGCGCSTSPTPGSTPRGAPSWTASWPRPRRPGRPSSSPRTSGARSRTWRRGPSRWEGAGRRTSPAPPDGSRCSLAELWRETVLVAGKDLRIELRSRVGAQQVAPFALVVLVLFGLAFDANQTLLRQAAPGLFWVAVTFAGVLAVQRAFGVEAADGARDGLRLSGMDPAGIFLGKAAALIVQLLVLQVVLAVVMAVLFTSQLHDPAVLVVTALVATIGLAAAGTLYGIVAASLRVRETLLPLLLLPVLAPVLLAATRAWSDALTNAPGAWGWMRVIGVFAVVYVAAGVLAFGSLLEDA